MRNETLEDFKTSSTPQHDPVPDPSLLMSQAEIADLDFGISHRMRSPIAIAKCNVEMLLDSKVFKHDGWQHLQIVHSQLEKLQDRLAQFNAFCQPLQPVLRVRSLLSVLDQIQPALFKRFLAQNIDFRLNQSAISSIRVLANERLLTEALLQLVTNALDVMPEGGILLLDATEVATEKRIYITLHDTGKGMEREILKDIGKPFFTTKPDGLGLGVAKARKIIAAHSGNLIFNSSPGEGTTVTIVLPAVENGREYDV